YQNQQTGKVVSRWPDIDTDAPLRSSASTVAQIMSTRVFTVKESDLAEMATSVMAWKNIHHVPVENDDGIFCGLLTWTHASKLNEQTVERRLTVADIMTQDVLSVGPQTSIQEAIRLMKENEYGCLPILQDNELVGIVTIKDVIAFDND
ncbi:MAG: CBS domain-containing protein, partial [Bacteroidota bacterium]